jgi:hypothetical protein
LSNIKRFYPRSNGWKYLYTTRVSSLKSDPVGKPSNQCGHKNFFAPILALFQPILQHLADWSHGCAMLLATAYLLSQTVLAEPLLLGDPHLAGG